MTMDSQSDNKKTQGRQSKLSVEDVEYIKRDIDYSVEQLKYYIDAYLSSRSILEKGNTAKARKELEQLLLQYVRGARIESWGDVE